MAIKFNRSQTFATGGTVTAADLHNLVDGTDIYPALITDQGNLATVSTADKILIADVDDTVNAKSTTVQNLFDDALSAGTYTDAYLTGRLSYGTATGNRTVSTSASITAGTINNATLGTTTGTTATLNNATITSGTITSGVISAGTFGTTISTAATITTGTIASLAIGTTTATSGTITNLNSTTGTIATLNSTTGTIANLSTTISGDFTITGGVGTLGTSGVTAGTYGTSSVIPRITVDAKGRVISVGTSSVSAGKILQVARAETSANTSGNASIPLDNTKPQSTEGFEVLTCSITPLSATSKLYIVSTIYCGETSNAISDITCALFRDSGSDAIAVSMGFVDYNANDTGAPIYTSAYVDTGSTSLTTIKARIGQGSLSGNLVLNTGTATARSHPYFNGLYKSSITIMEVEQ